MPVAGVGGGPATPVEKAKANSETPGTGTNFSRETSTVFTVRKTRESIVELKITKPGAKKDKVGTGVILSALSGLIVTSHHVIKNAAPSGVKVRLFDRSVHAGKVIFVDASEDLAAASLVYHRARQEGAGHTVEL